MIFILVTTLSNPWLHNPTGASISLQVVHRLLNLAERHHITVVEDNVSGDLLGPGAITLATLAGLERVIHIGSFSKSVSPGFRVGYVVAAPKIINRLMQYKMMSGLTSSSLAEQVTLNVIRQPAYRKHLKALRLRLGQAQQEMYQFLQSIHWDVFCVPDNGYYIYTRPHANAADSRLIAEEAKRQDCCSHRAICFTRTTATAHEYGLMWHFVRRKKPGCIPSCGRWDVKNGRQSADRG